MTATNGISSMRGATCSTQLRGPRSLPPITSTASNVPMPVASTSRAKAWSPSIRDADAAGEVDEAGLRARNEAEVEQAGGIRLFAARRASSAEASARPSGRQAHEGEASRPGPAGRRAAARTVGRVSAYVPRSASKPTRTRGSSPSASSASVIRSATLGSGAARSSQPTSGSCQATASAEDEQQRSQAPETSGALSHRPQPCRAACARRTRP